MSQEPRERIYLQYTSDDVTWCVDRINDDDTAYVRADLFDALTAERDALLARLADAATEAGVLIDFLAMRTDLPDECDTPDGLCGHWVCDEIGCVVDKRAALRALTPSTEP